jgi:hypothetical protein
MAEWKKVVVSGSDISQLNNDAGYLTNATIQVPNGFSTASFNGTDLLADSTTGTLNFASSSGQGLDITATAGTDTLEFGLSNIPNSSLANSTISGKALGTNLDNLTVDDSTIQLNSGTTYNGSAARTISVKNGGIDTTQLADGAVTNAKVDASAGIVYTKLDFEGSSFVSSSAQIDLGSATGNIALGSQTTGDYVESLGTGTGVTIGSNSGEGSNPTIAVNYGSTSNTAVQGNTNITLNQTAGEIDITGTAAQALGGAPSYTIGLADTISGNRTFSGQTITINNDLIVQGTASFQSTENLQVADQFILLNSGSTGTGPGGIVIEQGTDDIGEALAWSSADSRWGVTGSFDAASTSFDPDAYVNVVVEGTTNDPDTEVVTKYDKKGNMFVGNTGDIWIYV